MHDLIDHLADALSSSRRPALAALWEAVALDPGSPPPGERAPVCAQLGPALDAALTGAAAPTTRALLPLLDGAVWRQNATYLGSVGEAFLANYAYVELVGPQGRWRSEAAAAGLLLLGAHTHYPAHAHPAHEDYLVLTPGASFQVGARRHTGLRPGSRIAIPSETPHAMTTGATPLLALYLWTGAIAQPARLLEETP